MTPTREATEAAGLLTGVRHPGEPLQLTFTKYGGLAFQSPCGRFQASVLSDGESWELDVRTGADRIVHRYAPDGTEILP